jgi:hypothetical protein
MTPIKDLTGQELERRLGALDRARAAAVRAQVRNVRSC